MLAIAQAVLEQVRATIGALVQQRQAVSRVGVLTDDDDADPRVAVRSRLANMTPSASPDGGMRMSVTTTSGSSAVDRLGQLTAVLARRHEIDARIAVEQVRERLAHEVVVVGDDDAQHGAVRRRRQRSCSP